MTNKIRVGVIGCGYIAKEAHLPILKSFKNVEVVAVCDLIEKNAFEVSKKFQIPKAYTNLNKMLEQENLDVIDICTPPQTHADLIKLVIGVGYPCIVEKPLTVTLKEADEVIKLSGERSKKIYVIHNYSFVPCMRRAKQIVAKGKLGKVLWVETRYFTLLQRERYFEKSHWVHRLPCGILYSEILPHLLMLILDFLEDPVSEIKVISNKRLNLPYVVTDEVKLGLITTNNTVGYVGLSYNSPILYHTLDLIGEGGALLVDFFTQTVVFKKTPFVNVPTDKETRNVLSRGLWVFEEGAQKLTQLTTTSIKTIFGRYQAMAEGHRFLFQKCFEDLAGKSEYPVRLSKCREVVRLLEAICNLVSSS